MTIDLTDTEQSYLRLRLKQRLTLLETGKALGAANQATVNAIETNLVKQLLEKLV